MSWSKLQIVIEGYQRQNARGAGRPKSDAEIRCDNLTKVKQYSL